MSDWPEVTELKGYTPKPGDVLFVTLTFEPSSAAYERMDYQFKQILPGIKVVILAPGMSVEVPK